MNERIFSTLIGYLFGCFLTAKIVAAKVAGKDPSELGDTGNPGMANIMESLGFLPGIATLAGDLAKCFAAMLISYYLFKDTGRIVMMYAGLGCTLGHDFPFWRRFRGGKGVATTSAAICIYALIPGIISNLIGMAVVFATQYLCIAGPLIPLTFMIWMFWTGDTEAGIISAVLTVLSVWAHSSSMRGIRSGRTTRTDVLGALRKRGTPKQDRKD